jgi:hypothetical protein
MPFLMRMQAEVYTSNALATKEAQQTQAQIERMSAILAETSQMLSGLMGQVSKEREAALKDLFAHLQLERQSSLEQIDQILQKERQATLEQANAAIEAQRKGIIKDLLSITDSAGRTGSVWMWRALIIGSVLIVLLLSGLLGTMLLYRRLTPRMERRHIA